MVERLGSSLRSRLHASEMWSAAVTVRAALGRRDNVTKRRGYRAEAGVAREATTAIGAGPSGWCTDS